MKKFLAGFCAAAIAAGCMGMTVMADTEATDKLTSYEATSGLPFLSLIRAL